MSMLLDTYRDVQEKKENPWTEEIPAQLLESISVTYREQYGREINSGELKIVLDGVGWITRMAADHHLSLEELMAISEDIVRNTRGNVEHARRVGSGEDAMGMGVGAGFFTGIWVGLLLK